MSLTGNNILGGASGQTTGYDIEQSVRFNSPDSARLTRTAGTATSNDIGTFSFWIKRGLVSGGRGFFSNHSDASNRTQITFDADKIMMYGVIGGSGSSPELVTTQVFRDPAAWYHIVIAVDVTQSTASNRVKIYVNGSQVTDFSTGTYPPQDTDLPLFSKTNMQVGAVYDGSVGGYYDGYFAEYYYIDGQALAPSSFGETNEDTNQWQAIEYDGSYGDNGFYLKFQDSSALGDDSSGNTNDFTATNLAATDVVGDSPTNNFCTINALTESITNRNDFSEGNLRATANDISGNSSAWFTATMGIPPNTGKWYWEFADEVYIDADTFGGSYPDGWGMGLLADDGNAPLMADTDISNTGWWFSKSNNNVGTSRARGGSTSSENKRVPSTSTGVFKCCYDSDNGAFWFGGDLGWTASDTSGTPETSDQPGSGNDLWDDGTGVTFAGYTVIPAWATINAGGNLTQLRFNFGQDSTFAGIRSGVSGTAGNPSGGGYGGNTDANGYGDFFYEVPTSFKALCSKNLPDPAIADPTAHFDTALYTGNGSTQTISSLNFQPDFVWIKNRTDASTSHGLFNSVMGAGVSLKSNDTVSERPVSGSPGATDDMYAFTSSGFSVGTDNYINVNTNTKNYASWNWKAGGTASTNEEGSLDSSVSANTTAGFSVLTYTGNETAGATVGHGLSQAPELVINKVRGASSQWYVNATAVSDTSNKVLMLNDTGALDSGTLYFNDTDPTSTLITLGSYSLLNSTGSNLIYCWHSVEGYSKIGKYTGNGSTDGTFVYTGFRPAFVMIKRYDSSSGANWILLDSKRDTFNIAEDSIYANHSIAEEDVGRLDFVSNGFKLRQNGTTVNTSSGTYIYLAIAESPFKTSNAR